MMGQFLEFTAHGFDQFMRYTAFANFTVGHVIMLIVALIFLYLAIAKDYEPLLLVPIGFGILIGNIPFLESANLQVGIYGSRYKII
jgi:oxaloacetate decarboxylase beta subunit